MGKKIIIDNFGRLQQCTNSDNDDKITKLESMIKDQKNMFDDFIAKMNEEKSNDGVKSDGDSRTESGIMSNLDIVSNLENQMHELRETIKEIKTNQVKEQYLYRSMLDTVKKQCDEKITRTTMAIEDLEHSHNEKIFQLLRAIENLTQASDGLKKEVGTLKSAKTGSYFGYLKG